MMGTQVALSAAKMMYVLQPMLWIAGGVMYTMMNYMLEISTVHSNLKRRSLRCRSSSQPLRSKSPSVLLSMAESPKGRPIQLLGSRL